MEDYQHQPRPILSKPVAAYVVGGVAGLGLGGYALHEHRIGQSLTAEDGQVIATQNVTRSQVDGLTATVRALAARPALQPV